MPITVDQMSDGAGTVTIAGKTYHLRKVTGSDWGRLRAWLRQRLPNPFDVVDKFRESCRPPEDPPADQAEFKKWKRRWEEYNEDRRELLLAAKADHDAGEGVFDKPQAKQLLTSLPGIAFQIWLAAHRDRSDLKLEDLERDLENEDLQSIGRALDAVNGLPDQIHAAIEKKAPETQEAVPF